MAWVRLDDQFFDHRKVVDLSKDAKLLFLSALAYCAAQARTGILTPAAVRIVAAKADVKAGPVAAELVKAGLWEPFEEGYVVHDFNVYNPTPEQLAARKKGNADRQREFRERQKGATGNAEGGASNNGNGQGNTSRNAVTNPVTDGMTNATKATLRNDVTSRARLNPFPDPFPDPDVIRSASGKTTDQTEGSTRGEAQGDAPPVGRSSVYSVPSSKSDQQALIAQAIRENPHWENIILRDVYPKAQKDRIHYACAVVVNWLNGDGTPDAPKASGNLPARKLSAQEQRIAADIAANNAFVDGMKDQISQSLGRSLPAPAVTIFENGDTPHVTH
jgi:hypothetical protein